jgi:hypothetical protein
VRRYRKIIVVASEGRVTEVEYLNQLNDTRTTVHLHCIRKGDRNSPEQVLAAIKTHLKAERLQKRDEAWVVVDTDTWGDDALRALHDWSLGRECYGLAVSNPKFELWLLLHFEDGKGACTPALVDRRLGKHITVRSKHAVGSWLTEDSIKGAIARARAKDSPPCGDWPRNPPGTTVYRLVERFLAEA